MPNTETKQVQSQTDKAIHADHHVNCQSIALMEFIGLVLRIPITVYCCLPNAANGVKNFQLLSSH